MDEKGTIRAVQGVLCDIIDSQPYRGWEAGLFTAEGLAQKRFFGKLERPDRGACKARRESCWTGWLESDNSLQPIGFYKPDWGRAKLVIARILKGFQLGAVSFTNGSEFEATFGYNSIEHKLSRSSWTCTPDNFDLWARTVYTHRGLKVAMRKRWLRLLSERNWQRKETDRILWDRFRKKSDPGYAIFCFKLSLLTQEVRGNRFSTVPKNNLKDRAICIEPLGNILTQRRIGIGIRACLKRAGLDLDTAADKHRSMISIPKYATIDLKDASDRISINLVRYLIPRRVLSFIEQARSEMTLGPDDTYYYVKKVSSMGNGFTFELMSLILYAISTTFSSDCSVFGDDIIVPSEYANNLINALESAHFVVNRDKTHINDGYRESCGAHYIDGHGYVESFDFRWPTTMADVITCLNKLQRLASLYASFSDYYEKVYWATPGALHPGSCTKAGTVQRRSQDPLGKAYVDTYVRPSHLFTRDDGLRLSDRHRRLIRRYCMTLFASPSNASLHLGYEWVDRGSKPSSLALPRSWAKYMMYLASGRRCCATKRGNGTFKSFLVVTLSDGTSFRLSDLVATCREARKVGLN